jgi:hypothetical protein
MFRKSEKKLQNEISKPGKCGKQFGKVGAIFSRNE